LIGAGRAWGGSGSNPRPDGSGENLVSLPTVVANNYGNRPPGYTMVDLVSDLAHSSIDTLRDAVRGTGCDSFTVHRD
jgi:hypothetical protein